MQTIGNTNVSLKVKIKYFIDTLIKQSFCFAFCTYLQLLFYKTLLNIKIVLFQETPEDLKKILAQFDEPCQAARELAGMVPPPTEEPTAEPPVDAEQA